jgi:hypothetical protein
MSIKLYDLLKAFYDDNKKSKLKLNILFADKTKSFFFKICVSNSNTITNKAVNKASR